jgi:hypothetical protein
MLPAVVPGHVTVIETFEPTSRVEDGMQADEPLLELLDPLPEELDPLEEPVPLDEPAPLLLLPEIDPLEDPLDPPEPDELPELPPEPLLDPPSSGVWTWESLDPPHPPANAVARASADPPQIAPIPRTR